MSPEMPVERPIFTPGEENMGFYHWKSVAEGNMDPEEHEI